MADRYPLIVDSSTNTVKEIPSGDNLNLSGSSIVNATGVNATNANISGVTTASTLKVNGIDVSPITGSTTLYVSTSGNDTTGDGSLSTPFATPHRVMEYLSTKVIQEDPGGGTRVTVNVGVGTYNFGLKISNTGSGYRGATFLPVSGGSGSGAYVGIITTGSTGGIVTNVFLLKGGNGYVAGESLGVSTTVGSGLAFSCFNVSSDGSIIGPLYVNHPQGHLIDIIGGATSGTKPGNTGNHFYNQAGVGVGSAPAGTGPNFSWSVYYDSTSPAGAYPNPMVNGQGNTSASRSYNESILQTYYGTEFYFHGCPGLISVSEGCAMIDRMALFGRTARGFAVDYTTFTTPFTGSYTGDNSTGVTNSVRQIFTDDGDMTTSFDVGGHKLQGGNFALGPDISISGFGAGIITRTGGVVQANNVTVTNCGGVGIRNYWGGDFELTRARCLNNALQGIISSGGNTNYAAGVISNNNGSSGYSFDGPAYGYGGNAFPNTGFGTQKVSAGSSSFFCNNGAAGIAVVLGAHVRMTASAGGPEGVFIYGNTNAQVQASRGASYIEIATAGISTGHGNATLYSPALNDTTNIYQIISYP